MTKDEFRHRREALGLSQTALSRELGVGLRTLQEWEAGQRRIKLLVDLALRELERGP
jgi:DNA-binding transcriptional regulator YiaG